jgi:phosphoesterase RecJ-like protein
MDFSLKQIAELLQNSSTIIITAHIHPDGDCLGSMLALNEYLTSRGKSVKMVLDDEVPALYNFLPGYETIGKPTAKVISADLLVVLDASDIERIGKVKEHVNAPILNIDHHISNTKFADYWYINSKSAATGEIILQLLNQLNAKITPTIATCLYTAIATDCGFFRYANTSVQTMRYAADLMEYGANPNAISEYMETKPLESILTLAKVLETLELHHNGKIATITVSPDTLDNLDSTEGFINYPRIIEGVEIAIMFKIMNEDTIRISFRSKKVDVSTLAFSFGGGGHVRAAGCAIMGKIEDVKKKVLSSAIKQVAEIVL